jgi:hypothetical protein
MNLEKQKLQKSERREIDYDRILQKNNGKIFCIKHEKNNSFKEDG